MSDQPERKRRKRVLLYDEVLPAPLPSEDQPPFGNISRRPDRSDPDSLSKIELNFCWRYTTHYSAQRAAIEAGYNPSGAHTKARQLLSEYRVKHQINIIETERLKRMRFDGDVFLARELLLASADVTELIESWIPPCRHCYGTNNEYQRTHAEYQEAWDAYMLLSDRKPRGMRSRYANMQTATAPLVYDERGDKLPFDQKGGDGYDPSIVPNPSCPNCNGRGLEHPEHGTIPYIRLRDSRELSDAGKALYAGMEHTTRGVKQLVHSQDAAKSRIMTLLGKFLEVRALDPSGARVPSLGFGLGVDSSVADLLTDDPGSLSDRQLDNLLASFGVIAEDVEQSGEGASSPAADGEAPSSGRIA